MLNFKWVNIAFIITIGISLVLITFEKLEFWSLLIVVFFYLFILFRGVTHIEKNFFIESINHLPDKKRVLLTFDDGPHPEYTAQILRILDKYQAKAVFFVIGRNAEKYPDLLKEIHQRGHIIANHSYSHDVLFDVFSTRKMVSDVEQANLVINKTLGFKPAYFRPPFGITNPRIKRLIKRTSLISVGWSFRSYDTGKQTNDQIFTRLKKQIKGGNILLFHDNLQRTIGLLELILPWLSENYNIKKNDL